MTLGSSLLPVIWVVSRSSRSMDLPALAVFPAAAGAPPLAVAFVPVVAAGAALPVLALPGGVAAGAEAGAALGAAAADGGWAGMAEVFTPGCRSSGLCAWPKAGAAQTSEITTTLSALMLQPPALSGAGGAA